MRTISKSIVATIAATAITALGASAASATITPTAGTVTATNTGTVVRSAVGITNSCETVNFSGDINMDNAAGAGGGGIVTGWTTGGCMINPTGNFSAPWTLNINTHVGTGSTWTGSITGVDVSISFCHFTGSLPLDYDNSTGRMTITGGTLGGGLCGSATITGAWDLHSGSGFPVVS